MELATSKSLRLELLNDLNNLRLACAALELPMEPAEQAVYLDDVRSACDSMSGRLDDMFGPMPVHPDRVAPFQWIMDAENYPQA